MPGYAKFMKYLVTKTRTMSNKPIDNVHHFRAFTIPYTIGFFNFAQDLCDLEASKNLMSIVVFKKLGLREPKPISKRLLMAHQSVKTSVDIICAMLVK